MIQPIISKCGNRCSDCPWSKFMRQYIDESEWDQYSEQVKKYIGIQPVKYEWEGCVGCNTPTENLPKHPHYGFLKSCKVRQCVLHNEIESCAYCSRFPCAHGLVGISRDAISKKVQEEIPSDVYMKYIRMFDSMNNLHEIRKSIPFNQIKDPKKVEYASNLKNPSNQISDKSQKQFFTKLYLLFSSDFGTKDADTLVGVEVIKQKFETILRILWLIGTLGSFEGNKVKIDSITLTKNKKSAKLPANEKAWESYTSIFTEFGLKSKLDIMTDVKKLYTPMGYMREKIPQTNKPSYYLTMIADSELSNIEFLKQLHNYTSQLEKIVGVTAYSKFKNLKIP